MSSLAHVLSLSWMSSNTFGTIALGLSLLLILCKIFYRLTLSPLAAVPGPWYAAVSDFWLTTHVMRLGQCFAVHDLFDKYGPIVRIGPNKIAFRDLQATRNVYSVHKFDKSSFYKALLTNDNDHAMTTLPHAPHAAKKRGYSPHYNPTNLALWQSDIHVFTGQLISALEETEGKTSLECLQLFRHLLVDVLSTVCFGYRVGAFSKYVAGIDDPLPIAINDFPKRGVLRSLVPGWAWNLVCQIPGRRWQQICESDKILAEFVSTRLYSLNAQLKAGILDESEKIPLIHRLVAQEFDDRDIISECMGHLLAGVDTTSTTLSYLFWVLSRRPDVLKSLQHELDQVMQDSHAIPDITVLQRLPYLNAFLKEVLRVYGAAPSLLERVVSSSANDQGFDLMGFKVPAGTIVATQAWSMHRNHSVFDRPDEFIPERWLIQDEAALARMSQHMMPFGTGSRVCGGQNLAHLTLRIVVAAVVRNFDIIAPGETTEKSMQICDAFVTCPAAMECKLAFKARQH